jgi:CBS domain-containing protein
MRARDLAVPFPSVSLDHDAMTAAALMAADRAPGIIVCDAEHRPTTVLPGSQVLNFLIPRYVQDQPSLAHAFDEDAADELHDRLATHTVRDVLQQRTRRPELPVVDADATSLEVAAVMARMHSPLVAVVDADGVALGAITVGDLLTHLLPS